jgi:hypothetical protein
MALAARVVSAMSYLNPSRPILAHPWRIAALVATVANIAFAYLNGRIGTPSPTVADISARYPTLLTPASYAFAIWGVIYACTFLYAAVALVPTELETRMHDRIAPWLVLLNSLSALWIALFSAEQLGPSVLICGAMLAASLSLYTIASNHIVSEHLSRWWRVPFGLWLGWLTVALLANLNVAMTAAGWDGWPSAALWASLMLLGAAVVAHSVGALFLDPTVAFVVAWAALAIAGEHAHESTLVTVVALAIALKCTWLGTRLSAFNTLPIPRDFREAIERQLRFSPAKATGATAHASRSVTL